MPDVSDRASDTRRSIKSRAIERMSTSFQSERMEVDEAGIDEIASRTRTNKSQSMYNPFPQQQHHAKDETGIRRKRSRKGEGIHQMIGSRRRGRGKIVIAR